MEQLWGEYGFPGTPPFEGSQVEERLHKLCIQYAGFIEKNELSSPNKTLSERKAYDVERRNIHNQIALMVMNKPRSGMNNSLAEKIAEFAFEYARGYKMKDMEKYLNKENAGD